MPVARIVTRQALHESQALNGLPEQLRAAGYQVEIVAPGTEGPAADLVIELDELPAGEALDTAIRLARAVNADLYVAPGVVAAEHAPQALYPANEERTPVPQPAPALPATAGAEHGRVIGEIAEQVGDALSDARLGIGDTVSRVKARVGESWTLWQRQRTARACERRMERERREREREELRRQHQLELQRRAEEKQRLLAERERLAAEEMAREAALRAERERVEREAIAREALRRAEAARAGEDRRRQAALAAERQRAEQQARRAAAFEAERTRLEHEEEARRTAARAGELQAPPPLAPVPNPAPVSAPEPVRAAPAIRPRPAAYRRRRSMSSRERQWRRAALIASAGTLAAMIAFALTARMRPSSPLPSSVIENPVQQQIPFGPAKLVPKAATTPGQAAAPVKSATEKPAAAKPAPAKSARPHRARHVSRETGIIAEDEVIVHHFPRAHPPHAQTRAGVRHISDEDY
jgi:hypothetical protein